MDTTRHLSMLYHPDRIAAGSSKSRNQQKKQSSTHDKFCQIQNAYEVLSSPSSRRLYDLEADSAKASKTRTEYRHSGHSNRKSSDSNYSSYAYSRDEIFNGEWDERGGRTEWDFEGFKPRWNDALFLGLSCTPVMILWMMEEVDDSEERAWASWRDAMAKDGLGDVFCK
ncbi:hypothetical protein HK096_004380 [Nowakowskiella sp. JEL0078]|nr:hypothetical protein HK096_004380 [Nowakowskiella sp. JEL0078]